MHVYSPVPLSLRPHLLCCLLLIAVFDYRSKMKVCGNGSFWFTLDHCSLTSRAFWRKEREKFCEQRRIRVFAPSQITCEDDKTWRILSSISLSWRLLRALSMISSFFFCSNAGFSLAATRPSSWSSSPRGVMTKFSKVTCNHTAGPLQVRHRSLPGQLATSPSHWSSDPSGVMTKFSKVTCSHTAGPTTSDSYS